MKKQLAYLATFCALAYPAMAQENLIPNAGFEEYYKLPDKDGCFNDYISHWSNLNNEKGYPNATPDYLHKKGTKEGAVSAYYYSKVEPYEGDAMMGLIVMARSPAFYEYVCAPLRQPLGKGKRYEVSFYIVNGEPKYCKCSARGFGLYFSKSAPKQKESERVEVTPQVMIEDNLHTKTWEKVAFQFTADGDYSHMTVGYFPPPDAMKLKDVTGGGNNCVYFFVDNFRLVEIPQASSTDVVALNLPNGVSHVASKFGAVSIPNAPEAREEKKETQLSDAPSVQIQVRDKKTGKPIAADVSLIDLATQKELAQKKFSESQTSITFSVEAGKTLAAFAKAQGYLEASEPVTAGKNAPVKVILLNPIEKGASIVLRNVYFETAKADLRPEASAELNKLLGLMKENATMSIEISGHTDSEGEDAKNLDLSRRRAEAVIAYLQKGGIASARLKSVGYGESKPIAANDTPEGRQQNRRVELKILGI